MATLLPYTNTRRNPSPQTGWPYCVYYSPATLPLIPSKQASKQPRSPRSILRGPSLKTFAIIDMGAWVGGAPRPRMSRTWKHTPAAWQGGAKGLNFKPPCRHPAKMGGRAGVYPCSVAGEKKKKKRHTLRERTPLPRYGGNPD